MEVRHCPRCGSDDISKTTGSAEYSHWSKYSCDCGWGYKDGSGMGVSSRSRGAHPRDASPNEQHTLDGDFDANTPGQWCSTCETCARPKYCGCVEDDQIGLCETCADFSEHDTDEMLDVQTYFGRHKDSPFDCEVCGENKAELKVIE